MKKPNGHAKTGEAVEFARMLEESGARAAAALALVDRLEAIVARVGGYMEPTDQATLREARAFLEECGARKPRKRTEWRDRR